MDPISRNLANLAAIYGHAPIYGPAEKTVDTPNPPELITQPSEVYHTNNDPENNPHHPLPYKPKFKKRKKNTYDSNLKIQSEYSLGFHTKA